MGVVKRQRLVRVPVAIVVAVALAGVMVEQKPRQGAVVMGLGVVVAQRQRLGQLMRVRIRRQARKQAEVQSEQGAQKPHWPKGTQWRWVMLVGSGAVNCKQ